ncbi:hypothetical protein [Scytonema sp. NUACC21]
MLQSPIPLVRSLFSTVLTGVAAATTNALILVRTTVFVISLAFLLLFVNSSSAIAQELAATNHTTRLLVTNQCNFPEWMATTPNANKAPLRDGIVKLSKGQSHDCFVPTEGWAGRL